MTLERVCLLRDEGAGRVTHTNHCRHPDLLLYNDQFPPLIQSPERQRRLDQLLDPPQNPGLEEVQGMLRDHLGFPHSICRHANDEPKTGGWETVFSVIIEPDARQMHISRGTPCEHPYAVYSLA